ncbi:MAG: class I SAM-dependent methyltransferase [Clostridia bacterium]|nr:class I SAM-dependent methyltransferase [Clostridia bacterium]
MNSVNKTLYIPLYGKSYVSRKGVILSDKWAEDIWEKEGFALKGKSRSRWLAYYMGMRALRFDTWLGEKMAAWPEAVVLHIGCGMDSRVHRVGTDGHPWYDLDFPEVIEERKRYYTETEEYHMLPADVRSPSFLDALPRERPAIVVMEGVSMYLRPQELQQLLQALCRHFSGVQLLLDCYTSFAARISRYKNPINDVGVTEVFGLDDPLSLEKGTGMAFVQEHPMTPESAVCQLKGLEKWVFRRVYGGAIARKMYRLYEYQSL